MAKYLFQIVSESSDNLEKAAALTEIGTLFRHSHDVEALRVLCGVVADEFTKRIGRNVSIGDDDAAGGDSPLEAAA